MKGLFVALCTFLFVPAIAQFTVSPNGHYVLRDGKDFFWLGDTGWELFHRLTREEADLYLETRHKQGFTVIQAVILAEFDGLHSPNAYGDLPLLNDDPAMPNENYFRHVDYIIDKAAAEELVIGLLPTWGDKVTLAWGKGPLVFTPENARVYGRWLANRYRNKKNIIWILGGDRNPSLEAEFAIWRSMAAGIQEGIGDRGKALISYHPQPNERGSGQYFYSESWFSFNMFQNGHCRNGQGYEKIFASWQRNPPKPVIDGEPIYEDHPVCFNVKDLGTSSAYDVRQYAYLDLFAGAFGHTYGCHDIWQFYSDNHDAINGPHVYWTEAMNLPGASQMKYVRRLMESHGPLTERIPDPGLVVENNLAPGERIQATRGKDYLFVYTAAGRSFTVMLGKISGKFLNVYWFNPRNGELKADARVENSGTKIFKPPTSGYGQDWILVMDDTEKNYPLF